MSDDLWRRGRDDDFDDDWSDVGDPTFADDPEPLPRRTASVDDGGPMRFGDDTGALPHWSEPPTGEVPRLFGDRDPTEDLDVWSSFAQSGKPAWQDDRPVHDATTMVDDLTAYGERPMGALDESDAPADPYFDLGEPPPPPPRSREPIRIGIDPTSDESRPVNRPRPVGGPGGRPGAPPRPGGRPMPAAKGGTKGRDMPSAIILGVGLALAFVALLRFGGPRGVMILVVVVMALAAFEFYGRCVERGYRPAVIPGIVACALLPVAGYTQGETGLVLGVFLAFVAASVATLAGNGEHPALLDIGITMLGVVWIGMLGGFAGLILSFGDPYGTDTFFLMVLGVVANDVGALLVGSAAGRTPLREWVSPNKTVEGLVGGAILTIGALLIASIAIKDPATWNDPWEWIRLGILIALLAPIGDLTESMFKRSLEIKDFGTLLPGHGGVLDRFDGFLFVMPAAYYALRLIKPWMP